MGENSVKEGYGERGGGTVVVGLQNGVCATDEMNFEQTRR